MKLAHDYVAPWPLQVERLVQLLVAHGMDKGSVQGVLQQVEEETGWGSDGGDQEGEEGEGQEAGPDEDLT